MDPYQIAKDTWVLPHLFPAPPYGEINVNSMIIAGKEPVIVDTGPAMVRDDWLRQAWSIVDPEAVRWIFISHDDGDHVGNLDQVLEACPNARLVTGWFATGRMAVDQSRELPMPRCVWINDGDSFDAGDRTLLALRPPVFDSPTTRGLFDPSTGVYWGSDAFGLFAPMPVEDSADVAEAERWDSFFMVNRLLSPWHQWLDQARFDAHVDQIQKLGVETLAVCHGPGFRGELVDEAFRRIRTLPSLPPLEEPGNDALQAMLAELTAQPGSEHGAEIAQQVA
ncbi:MAG TPA: MBL fold metallo-hydrolase [Candidatus Dormibacteraeota bacterium]|nr:MBL fold metallo-hydrolase [Candidatus Dormibacteraeota bacterium]